MNTPMVKRLMFKEWYFQRWSIALYVVGGIASLALLTGNSNGSFYIATVLLITVMIGVGVQIAITAGVYERTEQTLPFLMTLPVSPREYATAKIVSSAAMFFFPWLLLSLAAVSMIGMSRTGAGLTPFAAIVLTELLASFCLVLGVAIVTESQGSTIGVMIASNLFLQGFLYYVSHMPAIGRTMQGRIAVWNPTAIGLILGELAISALLLAIALVLQSSKKEFI